MSDPSLHHLGPNYCDGVQRDPKTEEYHCHLTVFYNECSFSAGLLFIHCQLICRDYLLKEDLHLWSKVEFHLHTNISGIASMFDSLLWSLIIWNEGYLFILPRDVVVTNRGRILQVQIIFCFTNLAYQVSRCLCWLILFVLTKFWCHHYQFSCIYSLMS